MSSNDPAADLRYRRMREDDVDDVVDLFNLAGWGPMKAEWIVDWFFRGPLGPALVMVAVDPSDRARGMIMFSPVQVQLFDRVGIACRGRSAILAPELRRSARGVTEPDDELDPLLNMVRAATEQLDELGWEFTFGLPNPTVAQRGRDVEEDHPEIVTARSDRDFRGLKVRFEDIPPGPIPLRVQEPTRPFGPEYDELWARARANLGIECAVLRNAEGLHQTRGDQPMLECRDRQGDELLGYAVY